MASATDIRDLLESQWSLNGELSKTVIGTPPNDMSIVVKFYDRPQVEGNEQPKAITVQKINKEGNEGIVQHPNFNEVKDLYEITIHYRIKDVLADTFSTSVDNVQKMGDEVTRILKLAYDPQTGTGNFFRVIREWVREDIYDGNQPEFRRRLFFTISKITSPISTVFTGFGGVLVFDTSESQGDSKPALDYTYVAVKNIEFQEGYSQIPYLTKDKSQGKGVPIIRRGMFSGTFSALMYAEKNNIDSNTIDKLQNIYKVQNNNPISGQTAEVVFLHSSSDSQSAFAWILGTVYAIDDQVTFQNKVYKSKTNHTASASNQPPNAVNWNLLTETLTTTSFLKINQIIFLDTEENLVTFRINGISTKPTVFGVS